MMQGRWTKILAGGLFLALGVGEARACIICAHAMADYVLPPTWLWVWLAVTWYLINAGVRSFMGLKQGNHPGLLGAFGALLVVGFLVLSYVGPLFMLLFFVPAVSGFHRAWDTEVVLQWPRGARVLRCVGMVYLVAVICAAGFTVYRRSTRTAGEYLCKWSVDGPGIRVFRELTNSEPASLPDYRYVVQNGESLIVGKVAERLAEIGDPVQDLPLLRAAVERLAKDPWRSSRLDRAVERMEERAKAAPDKR